MNRRIVFFLGLLTFFAGCKQTEQLRQAPLKDDPAQVELITSDITLFWEMYDREKPLFTAEELKEQYIEPGTPALSFFYEEKIDQPETYTGLLNSWVDQQFYEDIRDNTLLINNRKPQITGVLKAFKQIYPDAVFTDIIFVMGALNTGGVVLPNGQIVIAAEMFSKTSDADATYLSPWLQSVLRTPDYLPVVVIHELIHVQQRQFAENNNIDLGRRTLLERALLEGGAEFITHLVLDKFLNDQLLSYAQPIEHELWTNFRKTMNQRNFGEWLYNGNTSAEEPADLGYYIGFKIVEAYYTHAKDKQQAIKDIIQIKDGQRFLKQSGYEKSFK